MTTHTPGPWSLDDFEVSGDISGAAICRVLEADDFPCIEEGTEADVQAECEANARLIAAAPELLAALQAALPCVMGTAERVGTAEQSPLYQQVMAAINKATGAQ